MTLELGIFAALTLGVIVALVVPLVRSVKGVEGTRADYDSRVYRDQFAEIERDVDRGVLSGAEADAARIEVQRRLLAADAESKAGVTVSATPKRLYRGIAIGLLVVITSGAGLLYAVLGHPEMPDAPWLPRAAERLNITPEALKTQMAAADRAEASANESPKDQARWLALADLRTHTGQWDKATAAYDRASNLGPVSPDVWLQEGLAAVNAGDGTVSPQARAAFVQALRLDHQAPEARWYLGVAAVQDGKPAEALAIWRDLSRDSAPDAPWLPTLRQAMAEIARAAHIAPLTVTPAHPLDLIDGKATVVVNPAASVDAVPQASPSGMNPEAMVATLKEQLKTKPDNFEGWMLLGRSLRVLKDLPGSSDAYGRAVALKPDDLSARFSYADALLLVAETTQQRPPLAFFETVAVLRDKAPSEPDSLYLGGIAAVANGKLDQAKALWTQLRDSLPAGSPERQSVDGELQAIAGKK